MNEFKQQVDKDYNQYLISLFNYNLKKFDDKILETVNLLSKEKTEMIKEFEQNQTEFQAMLNPKWYIEKIDDFNFHIKERKVRRNKK